MFDVGGLGGEVVRRVRVGVGGLQCQRRQRCSRVQCVDLLVEQVNIRCDFQEVLRPNSGLAHRAFSKLYASHPHIDRHKLWGCLVEKRRLKRVVPIILCRKLESDTSLMVPYSKYRNAHSTANNHGTYGVSSENIRINPIRDSNRPHTPSPPITRSRNVQHDDRDSRTSSCPHHRQREQPIHQP